MKGILAVQLQKKNLIFPTILLIQKNHIATAQDNEKQT